MSPGGGINGIAFCNIIKATFESKRKVRRIKAVQPYGIQDRPMLEQMQVDPKSLSTPQYLVTQSDKAFQTAVHRAGNKVFINF